MEDFRNDWFMNQHWSKDELETLWEWSKNDNNTKIIKTNGKYIGYHIKDLNNSISLISMKEKSQAINWIKRLGFKYEK